MGDDEDIDLVLKGEIEPKTCTITVAGYTNSGDATRLERGKDLADARFSDLRAVGAKPFPKVEV